MWQLEPPLELQAVVLQPIRTIPDNSRAIKPTTKTALFFIESPNIRVFKVSRMRYFKCKA